jgi:DNA-binding NarL/FixJ family response regulator
LALEPGVAGILVIDSAAKNRTQLASLLRGAGYVTREENSGVNGIAAARDQRPDLVLIEVELGDVSGYEVCRQLRDRYGESLPVIFTATTRTASLDLVAGLLIGADDYVVRPFAPDELIARVRRALIRAAAARIQQVPRHSPYGLTSREREVLTLLAYGLSQKAIARELFISPQTVATHIQRILAKLDVHSRAEAVALAHREELVEDLSGRHVHAAG